MVEGVRKEEFVRETAREIVKLIIEDSRLLKAEQSRTM